MKFTPFISQYLDINSLQRLFLFVVISALRTAILIKQFPPIEN